MKTFPLYRTEKCRDYFVIAMRYRRGWNYSYFTCEKMGRFETRELAQAALEGMKAKAA